jgi:xylulose-5-phosphate/fructose-6-phosphate phosphoketolase
LGTSPGLNLIYAHLNRAVVARDLDVILLVGPGHGGPAIVANTYLEGTYCEIYPHVTTDASGLKTLFRQFRRSEMNVVEDGLVGVDEGVAEPSLEGPPRGGLEFGKPLLEVLGARFQSCRVGRTSFLET